MTKALVMTHSKEVGSLLSLQEVESAIPRKREVLIRVASAGLNRADLLQSLGKYPAPHGVVSNIPGLEVAGEIIGVGPDAHDFKAGDRVCALLPGGGFAEQVCIDERCCLLIPSNLSFSEAASLPEALYTVWLNVFQLGSLKANEKLLVHGGSSGIGAHSILLARAFGAEVSVTVGSEQKASFCRKLGATKAINYKEEDFLEAFSSQKFNVILDMVGGDYLEKNMELLDLEGRLVSINAMSGRFGKLDILAMMQKRIILTGSTLRNRSVEFKNQIGRELNELVLPLYESGQLKPVVFKEFPVAEAGLALELMYSSEHMGKIVLNF